MAARDSERDQDLFAEDVGTVDSGLNSMVLANNAENVLLPVNEPTTGTKRKSQIQTYLEQNQVRERGRSAPLFRVAFSADDTISATAWLVQALRMGMPLEAP